MGRSLRGSDEDGDCCLGCLFFTEFIPLGVVVDDGVNDCMEVLSSSLD